ncbi:GNAT family N-acetyltransferase [Oenococcus sp. UCMA 16435]|nr:GNAT family N-acetyltransferase [Oenococcus sp. UCMA 16435]MDI4584252.1 GNAT family N-acetyltransferase [Oenococcus sp. UCMA 14587]
MVLKLLKLTKDDGLEFYQMLQEIKTDVNGFHNPVYQMSFDEYKNWLIAAENDSNVANLKPSYVPQTTFWLYDERPIGIGRIRHYLNKNLELNGGHLAYAIRSTQRGKSYGNILFSLLLNECRKMKINPVQFSVQEVNEASNKIIKVHKGFLISKSKNGENIYQIKF